MQRKPRRFSVSFFKRQEIFISLFQGAMIASALLIVIRFGISHSFGEAYTRTLVFATLVFSNAVLTLTGRSRRYSLFKTLRYKNNLMPFMLAMTLVLFAMSMVNMNLRSIFGFVSLQWFQYVSCVGIALASVLWIELFKAVARHRVNSES